jgi:hypothetical protein
MNPVSEERAIVIEQKLDKLTETVQKLVLIDERQVTQGTRLGKIEEAIALLQVSHIQLERKVDKWINLFWGGWAVFSFGLMLYQKFAP